MSKRYPSSLPPVDTLKVRMGRPIKESNLTPVLERQGFLYSRMGFRGVSKFWGASWNGVVTPAALISSGTYTFTTGVGDRYHYFSAWRPVLRPIRRAKDALELSSVNYNTEPLEITDGTFFILVCVVTANTAGVNSGTCRFRLYDKHVDTWDDESGLPIVTTEILSPNIDDAAYPEWRCIPVELDLNDANPVLRASALQVVFQVKAGASSTIAVVMTSITEAPIASPWTYKDLRCVSGDALVGYAALAVNSEWQTNVGNPWVVSKTDFAYYRDRPWIGCHSMALDSGGLVGTFPDPEVYWGAYMGITIRPRNVATSYNIWVMEGVTATDVLRLQWDHTSTTIKIHVRETTTLTAYDTGIELSLDEWTDLVVAVIPRWGGRHLVVYQDGEIMYTRVLAAFGNGNTVMDAVVINPDATNFDVCIPHAIALESGDTFNQRDVEILNRTYRYATTHVPLPAS